MIVQPKSNADPSGYYKPLAYQVLTVDNSVKVPTVPPGTRMAEVFFRGGVVRMTKHGEDPTTIYGVPMGDGYENYMSIAELNRVRFIREGSVDGEIHFIYYG